MTAHCVRFCHFIVELVFSSACVLSTALRVYECCIVSFCAMSLLSELPLCCS